MPMTYKWEDALNILRPISDHENLGEIESFYYAVQRPNLFVAIFCLGILFLNLLTSYYYVACTQSHLIIQKLTAFANPKGGAYIVPWEHVQIIELKNSGLWRKVKISVEGKTYKLKMPSNLRKWNKDVPRLEMFMESFINRMNY